MELRSKYKEVRFVNLSMGALGVMSISSAFYEDMMKDLDFDESARKIHNKKTNEHIHSSDILQFLP